MVKTIFISTFILFHNFCFYYNNSISNHRCQSLKFIEISTNTKSDLKFYKINRSIGPEFIYIIIVELALFCLSNY
jgi:hypothetical protein